MKIEHADNTTEEFDVALHLTRTYAKNEQLVDGLLADDFELLHATGIKGIFKAYNKETLLTAMRDCLKAEIMFRLGASGWA